MAIKHQVVALSPVRHMVELRTMRALTGCCDDDVSIASILAQLISHSYRLQVWSVDDLLHRANCRTLYNARWCWWRFHVCINVNRQEYRVMSWHTFLCIWLQINFRISIRKCTRMHYFEMKKKMKMKKIATLVKPFEKYSYKSSLNESSMF